MSVEGSYTYIVVRQFDWNAFIKAYIVGYPFDIKRFMWFVMDSTGANAELSCGSSMVTTEGG